jgi:hypothetical protein
MRGELSADQIWKVCVTVICGPPIMIRFTLPVFSLAELDKLTKEY